MTWFGLFAGTRARRRVTLTFPVVFHWQQARAELMSKQRVRGHSVHLYTNVCIGYISAISQRNELKFCMIVI